MIKQRGCPGLQDAFETDLPADKAFIESNLLERLCRCFKKEGITEFLPRPEDRPKRFGKRKRRKEIGNGQKPVELFFQPDFSLVSATLGAMAVVARMISVLLGFALRTVIPFSAHHLRSALQDIGVSLNMGRRHGIPIPVKIRIPEHLKQIGEAHLDHIVHDIVNR